MSGSVAALQTLGAWQGCALHAAPLRNLRIVDDTARLIRAPEVFFAAAEIGLEAFGHNIENRHLLAALECRAAELDLPRIGSPALTIAPDADGVTIETDAGAARVRLLVGADGARSLARAAAGIAMTRHTYPQTALTLNLAHARAHDDTVTEFHTESGPFTLVPLPGRRCSLVCVLDTAGAGELSGRDDAALAAEIERRAHWLLGAMTVEPGRGVFPLGVETAAAFARGRIVLVGEAAHVVPPIGAQGLNLGLRDGATIAEIVADARRDNVDIGAPERARALRPRAPRRCVEPHRRGRCPQPQPAHGFFAGARRARAVALSGRPHRPAAPRPDARRRRAGRLAAAPDARGDGVTAAVSQAELP